MIVVIELGPASIPEDRRSVLMADVEVKTNSVAVKFLSHSHRCTKGVQLIGIVILLPLLLQSPCKNVEMTKCREKRVSILRSLI